MMMKIQKNSMLNIFFLLLIIFSAASSYAQKNDLDVAGSFEYSPVEGLEEYYRSVNKAELFFINNEYDSALSEYLKAFENKEYPFLIDEARAKDIGFKFCYDSVLISRLLLHIRAITPAKRRSKDIINHIIKKYHRKDSLFLRGLTIKLDSVSLVSTQKVSGVNKEIQSCIDTIAYWDQKTRTDKSYFHYRHERDSINLFQLLELYQKFPDITEQNASYLFYEKIANVLFHNHARFSLWYPVILKQVMSGNFYNRTFVDVLTDYYRDIKNDPDVFGFYQGNQLFTKYLLILLDEKQEAIVNKRREQFFLDPYLIAEKKKIWRFFYTKDSNNLFYMYPNEFLFPLPEYIENEEERNRFLKEQEQMIDKYKRDSGERVKVYSKYEKEDID